MGIISTRMHGYMDYLLGLVLICAPWVLGFASGGSETWVPVVLGAGVILYSSMTNYELGLIRVISMPAHLWLDVLGGVLLAASPWLFGFASQVAAPHLVFGILEIGTALMTSRVPGGRAVRA